MNYMTSTALVSGILMFTAQSAFAQKPATAAPSPTTITTTMAAANVGQTITLSSTAYKVNAKKVLATGVEYYAVKAITSKAPTKYFLRSNDRYSATVFTQAQYEAFISTGNVSSFGPVLMSVIGQDTLLHMRSGNTVALPMLGTNGELVVYEFINGAQTMALQTGQVPKRRPRVRGNQYTSCLDGCRSTYSGCNTNATAEADKEKCTDTYALCLAGCNVMHRTQPVSIHVISSSIPAVLY